MIAKVLTITRPDGSEIRYQDVEVDEDADKGQLIVWRNVPDQPQPLARLPLDQISYYVQE